MPLLRYSVLKGRPRAMQTRLAPNAHVHLWLDATPAPLPHFRVAVNVRSRGAPSELLYALATDLALPPAQAAALLALPPGLTAVPSVPGGFALDYVRGRLLAHSAFRVLHHAVPGPDNDLCELVEHWAGHAQNTQGAWAYAFGDAWGPENAPDDVFGFVPRQGLHDVHMNQGNAARWRADDGVWQDGALLFALPFGGTTRWIGLFLAFQAQAWATDDATGAALLT